MNVIRIFLNVAHRLLKASQAAYDSWEQIHGEHTPDPDNFLLPDNFRTLKEPELFVGGRSVGSVESVEIETCNDRSRSGQVGDDPTRIRCRGGAAVLVIKNTSSDFLSAFSRGNVEPFLYIESLRGSDGYKVCEFSGIITAMEGRPSDLPTTLSKLSLEGLVEFYEVKAA